MGIAIHNVSTNTGSPGGHADAASSMDLAAGVRQDAGGLLGTTVQLADLVRGYTPKENSPNFVFLPFFYLSYACFFRLIPDLRVD